MKGKEPLTLQEMAARANGSGGRMVCLKCGCMDFKSDGVQQGVAVTFRYRICRHCQAKYYTKQEPEQILRPVEPRKKTAENSELAADEDLDGSVV